MNLKKNIKSGKGGSYIVEASFTLPVFIIAVVALALIIKIISVCESISFFTGAEVRNIDIQAYKKIKSISLCKQIENRVLNGCSELSQFRVKDMDYLYRDNNIYDLIGVTAEAKFKVANPVGILGEITFKEKLLTRGFTGAVRNSSPLNEEEFQENQESEPVVVFPKYGIRFHVKSCRYVSMNYPGEEYKIEMEKEDAIRKKYTPCLVCGGG